MNQRYTSLPQIYNIGDATGPYHVIMRQQMTSSGVKVRGAVHLIRERAAACDV